MKRWYVYDYHPEIRGSCDACSWLVAADFPEEEEAAAVAYLVARDNAGDRVMIKLEEDL